MSASTNEFRGLLESLERDAAEGIPQGPAVDLIHLAEKCLAASAAIDADCWRRYLEFTGRSNFLRVLPGREFRHRWAETCFRAVMASGYTLETMLEERLRRHPDRIFLSEAGVPDSEWTFAQTAARLRLIAATFLDLEPAPRVALLCENGIDGACCDLACLVHGIFDTPLSVHFDAGILCGIFDRLAINFAVADSDERVQRLVEVRSKSRRPFRILRTGAPEGSAADSDEAEFLEDACARVDFGRGGPQLDARRSRPPGSVATVMFTSGSTGAPKGIAFTHYHLVTKRFARAAALPAVGDSEVLLSYLPLFHTFGRFLELLGSLYWGGTYVFSGNPSVETLISQMREVRPTGLIGVPLRWTQLRDYCAEALSASATNGAQEAIVRGIVGDRLRWGLSAAGHLDSAVFRFFQRFGIDLCSGFGMTEATGGITMTPPGEYVDGTVGIPLPGIRTRFGAGSELEISGPYVARYLDEDGTTDLPSQDPGAEHWLSTGDVFKQHTGGYLEIVDRVKDIYKNNRGQTIAPRRVEQKFENVPGIRRVFLVGDARESNALIIVPDRDDPVMKMPDSGVRDYFHQIVAAANAALAPFERVVKFALADRDFGLEHGELTPKGSYRRKKIEENFAPIIEGLYRCRFVERTCGNLHVRIPRWCFRDLGILEEDIVGAPEGLSDTASGRRLEVAACAEPGVVRVGDLEYRVSGSTIDLGLFARQPRLWAGNPALAAFCPCKDGWDLPLVSVSPKVSLPWGRPDQDVDSFRAGPASVRDERLRRIHRNCMEALFCDAQTAPAAVSRLGEDLKGGSERLADVIRCRLEALSRHAEEDVRCLAYRILLMDEPLNDYAGAFPAFVESGLTFLNEDSIRAIAGSGLCDRRLQSLRRRLFGYRETLDWPAPEATRDQFKKIFKMLADIAGRDDEFFGPVRAELASWSLHQADPELAESAERHLSGLNRSCQPEKRGTAAQPSLAGKVVFEDGISPGSEERLRQILLDPVFLKQSVMLVFDEGPLDFAQVSDGGIWISRIVSQHRFDLYRCGINLENGKHFDLLIGAGDAFADAQVRTTLYWLMALSEHPFPASVLPRLGACREDLQAISLAYINDLTVWEKIREYAGAQTARAYTPTRHDWRRIFVRGMSAFFAVWSSSGSRIVPGAVTPANVVAPDADFREGSCVLSLTGWSSYENPLSLVAPFIRNFYRQTAAHYPKVARQIELRWIFDACMEALGAERGSRFLMELEAALPDAPGATDFGRLAAALSEYRDRLRDRPYQPLPLLCAVDRFSGWKKENAGASADARAEEVEQLYWLYRLDRYPEMHRYRLYARTYFAEAGAPVHAAFDRLLARLFRQPRAPAPHLEELHELQAALDAPADREVFSRMVFPRARREQKLEVRTVGASEQRRVIVRSQILDRRGIAYAVREPVSPAEIGHLYRLLREADFHRKISQHESHLVVTSESEQVVGGLTWLPQGKNAVYVGALVVAPALKGRGIGGALVEDFCVRMAASGMRLVKTDFLIRRFYQAHDFHVDARWGGLVRSLGPPPPGI